MVGRGIYELTKPDLMFFSQDAANFFWLLSADHQAAVCTHSGRMRRGWAQGSFFGAEECKLWSRVHIPKLVKGFSDSSQDDFSNSGANGRADLRRNSSRNIDTDLEV